MLLRRVVAQHAWVYLGTSGHQKTSESTLDSQSRFSGSIAPICLPQDSIILHTHMSIHGVSLHIQSCTSGSYPVQHVQSYLLCCPLSTTLWACLSKWCCLSYMVSPLFWTDTRPCLHLLSFCFHLLYSKELNHRSSITRPLSQTFPFTHSVTADLGLHCLRCILSSEAVGSSSTDKDQRIKLQD